MNTAKHKSLSGLHTKVQWMQHKARSQKEENRARMPKVAALVDSFREEFGDGVKVLYASENGCTVGKEDDHDWVVPNLPIVLTPTKKTK